MLRPHSDGMGAVGGPVKHMTVTGKDETVPCVLVVDDNADAADLLAELLQAFGYRAFAVHSGEEAIDANAKFLPGIIFLDLGMPVMDGFETARKLLASPNGQHPKIVALTAWGDESTRRRVSAAGMTGHLVKPAEFALVLEIIARTV
jgi:CheY-like chemotaxis protein